MGTDFFQNIISHDSNTQRPIVGSSNQSQPYQPHMRYLPNKCDALQAHMHKVHKLGNAQTDTSYYTYYQILIKNKSAHSKLRNFFWSIPGISYEEKETVMKYCSGTIYNQKHAVRFKQSNSLRCPTWSCLNSALHILSGCQHSIIWNMVTERHNIAGRFITKAIS